MFPLKSLQIYLREKKIYSINLIWLSPLLYLKLKLKDLIFTGINDLKIKILSFIDV